jgi:hypothetical protein
MSETTRTASVEQVQSHVEASETPPNLQPESTEQNPEQLAQAAPQPAVVPEQPQEPTPEQAVAAGAQAAEEQAAAAEEAAREQADTTLKALVKAFRQGERAYRQGLLEAGRLCEEYLHQRLACGEKRSAAVQSVEGELAKWSSNAVDANKLIGAWHAYRLLAVEQGLDKAPSKGKPAPADAVAYGHYRDAWCRLVERKEKDTVAEYWTLLPGLEAECREAFAKAVAAGLSKDAASDAVRLLVQEQANRQAEQAKADKLAAEQEAVQAQQQAAAENQAVQEAIQAQQKAAAIGDPQAVQRAAEELRVKQTVAIQATAAAEQAQREADRKAAEEKAAKERADKEQAKADKAAAKGKGKGKDAGQTAPVTPQTTTAVPGNGTPMLPTLPEPAQATGKPAPKVAVDADEEDDPETMAQYLVEAIEESTEPDTVVEGLLARLVESKELAPRTKRALKLAVQRLKATDSPSPAEAAAALPPEPIVNVNANGQLVGAA